MLTSLLKGLLFVIVMAFYSMCVWRVVNNYFHKEFRTYIDHDPLLAKLHESAAKSAAATAAATANTQPNKATTTSHEIFGAGVDHRDAANFRTHIQTVHQRLNERHPQPTQPRVAIVDRDRLLDRLQPDLGEQFRQAIDESLALPDAATNGRPATPPSPDSEYKYAVMVFDNDLPDVNGLNAVDGDDGDDAYDDNLVEDYRDGNANQLGQRIGGLGLGLDADDVREGAFIVRPTAAHANRHQAQPPPPLNDRNIISTLDGGSTGGDGMDNKVNQLLVTNDLGDGDGDADGDNGVAVDDSHVRANGKTAVGAAVAQDDDGDDDESSGDNELITPIDGNLIKSLDAVDRDSGRHRSRRRQRRADEDPRPPTPHRIATNAAADGKSGDDGDANVALMGDCLCVRDDVNVSTDGGRSLND